ncbi:hypothetical protein D9611_013857 [Ephemerocybe angulata]|uniref:Uncharacterized protein n=1 Tax=Ephemerocybe angulata TaxID=980116 RepID=A0A8H5BT21_9AGAR|nr:hypothetical protein D9611_013857 [Tulosesus angulatus]
MMQQRQAIVPSTAVYPPPRGLLGPACRRPSQLLFRYPHSKTTEIDRDDSEAVVLLRRQLQAASRRRTSQVCDGDDNGEAEEDVDDEVQSVDEEVDYDDEGVVVAHAGQRLLPVLILRQRWRRRESRSAMACLGGAWECRSVTRGDSVGRSHGPCVGAEVIGADGSSARLGHGSDGPWIGLEWTKMIFDVAGGRWVAWNEQDGRDGKS